MGNDKENSETVKKSVSMPADLWNFVEEQAGEYGQNSPVIQKAIREMRDRVKKSGNDDFKNAADAIKRGNRIIEQNAQPISRVETDLQGRFRAVDEDFTRMCGRTIDEVRGKTAREAGLIRDDSDPVQLSKIRTAIKKRKKCVATLVNYRKDGSPYTVLIDMRPLKDGTGFEAFEREVID